MTSASERPADLPEVQGAWRREGRRLDGGAWEEVSDVLWLQVGHAFCDLRTARPGPTPSHALDVPQAFAGTVEVAHGDIAFHHDLDSSARDPAHPDVSTVHRIPDVLFERGPGFEERWVLVSRRGDETALAELWPPGRHAPLARIVRVGDVALAVWGGQSPGGAEYALGAQWGTVRVWRRGGDVPDVDDVARALATGDDLPTGWVSGGVAPNPVRPQP